MANALAQIREDLQDALDCARAQLRLGGGENCPCCGAVGRETRDPGAYDDGRILHDCQCLFAVLPAVLILLEAMCS